MKRLLIGVALAALATAAAPAAPDAATIDQLKSSKTLRIGFRVDAPPFSYKNTIGEAAGYSVEICRQVAAGIGKLHGIPDISVSYVPVTAGDRFDAVAQGRIDILCGATTQTLSRREKVGFSLATFIDGASVLYRADGPTSFAEMAGKPIGVRANTTTEEGLRNTLEREGIAAELIAVSDHEDGLKRLVAGEISAYFADRAILTYMMLSSYKDANLVLSNRFFSHEPYALAVPRGDDDFRLTVDRVLAALYKTGAIRQIFKSSFPGAQPTDMLKALYLINGLPE